jgi:death on curing protein
MMERGMHASDAIRYPNLVEAFALYNDAMGVTDDPGDLANRLDILASTLARPRNLALYEEADLVRQAASLLWGMIHNHPFADGNKRAGLHIALTFARVNGLAIIAPEDAVVELGYAVAEGRLDEEAVERWLRRYSQPVIEEVA